MTLQPHTIDGDSIVLQTHSEVIESCCLCLALQLNAIVIQVKYSIRICTVGKDEGGVYVIVADGQLPHALFSQVVAIGIGTYGGLIVVEALVDNIPLTHFAFVVLHHLGDVVLHNIQCFVARPTFVVFLAIGRKPGGLLRVPYQTMTAHHHIILLGKVHQLVGTDETERALGGLQCIHLHLILAHHHVELTASLITVTLIALIGS